VDRKVPFNLPALTLNPLAAIFMTSRHGLLLTPRTAGVPAPPSSPNGTCLDHNRNQTFLPEMDKFQCSVRLVKTEVMGQAEKSGVMTDLNILIPRDSTLSLVEAGDIKSRGEIVGQGVQKSTGELHAFLAIPCGEERSEDCEDEAESKSAAPSGIAARPDVALSEGVRELLRQRLTPDRFGVKRQ